MFYGRSFTLRLPLELYRRMETGAAEMGLRPSEFVRFVLEYALDEIGVEAGTDEEPGQIHIDDLQA